MGPEEWYGDARNEEKAGVLIGILEDRTNLSHVHALDSLLSKRGEPGDFERAERLERPYMEWMDKQLGRDAPQVLSSKRIVAKCIWILGRPAEAEELIGEIFELVEGRGRGSMGFIGRPRGRAWRIKML